MKVAIVCGAPTSEMLAPFDDPTWEIWCLGNRLNKYLDANKRITRVFEIHDNLEEHHDPKKYADWLVSHNLPLVVGEKFPIRGEVGGQIEIFPYAASEQLYGSVYLTSSPAYMMAYALLHGATEIALYGVHLAIDDHEYFWQRPCMEAWIGFAKGRGVNIFLPDQSSVGRSKYAEGRHWDGKRNAEGPFTEASFHGMRDEHQKKIDELQLVVRTIQADISAHNGAIEAYNNLAKVARAVEAQVDVKSIKDSISMA